jgi:hypothetical protein
MQWFKKPRLSPAMAVSLAALVVAMGGTAGATGVIGGKDQPTAHAAKKKKGKRGPRGFRGPQGPQGPQGAPGANGVNGAPGAALAYAHVPSSGGVDGADSRNLAGGNITHPTTGIYCVVGVNPAPHNAIVTIGFDGDAVFAFASRPGTSTDCPGGSQFQILLTDSKLARADADFELVLN